MVTLALLGVLVALVAHECWAWPRQLRRLNDPWRAARQLNAWADAWQPPCRYLGGHELDDHGCHWCDDIKVAVGWFGGYGNTGFVGYRTDQEFWLAEDDVRIVRRRAVRPRHTFGDYMNGLVYFDTCRATTGQRRVEPLPAGIWLDPREIDLYLSGHGSKEEEQAQALAAIKRRYSYARSKRSRTGGPTTHGRREALIDYYSRPF